MPTRLRYPELAPEGYAALISLGHYITISTALEPTIKGLVDLRASQLNGCEFCTAMHIHELRKHHEPQTRIDAVVQWQSSEAFTPRERAALAWTEALTLNPHASDDDYAAVSVFFHGKDLVDLTYAIANINAWNRLGIAFRPEWDPQRAHAQPEEISAVGDDGGKVAEDK